VFIYQTSKFRPPPMFIDIQPFLPQLFFISGQSFMLINLENIQCLKKENSHSIEIRDDPTVPKINEAKDIPQKCYFIYE
jgi:hypothetical protein